MQSGPSSWKNCLPQRKKAATVWMEPQSSLAVWHEETNRGNVFLHRERGAEEEEHKLDLLKNRTAARTRHTNMHPHCWWC